MVDSSAYAEERLRRPATGGSLRLGGTKVSYVPDGVLLGRPGAWLPDSTERTWAEHPEYLEASGYLVASVGGLLVEHGERALLIDAGLGPYAMPADPATPNGPVRGGALLENLAALGRDPDRIEAVAFSHLHPDHVGWAAHIAPGAGRPAFTRAAYLVAEPEWERHGSPRAGETAQEPAATLAPQVRTVADGEEIFPGVRARFAPGHTAGHTEFVITGGGRRLIAFGDSLHAPIQVDHPEWSCVWDDDPAAAAAHRRRLVAELEEPGTIGFGVHFADVVFGRVRRGGPGPAWRPLDAEGAEDAGGAGGAGGPGAPVEG
ncbi:MBL fold metallo-hydrolase [Streptomyces sp. NPDC088923]|uniref:MBL fold metallo-hydrolase n=1 Tax=Streptomyces sp. NPDC088923 TaxID=3365913 RepID=UPI0037F89EA1